MTLDEEELCGQHERVYVYAWGCCPLATFLRVLYTTGRVGWLESETVLWCSSRTAYRLKLNIELAIGLSQLLHNRLVGIIWANCNYLRWLWSLCTLNSNHISPLKLWVWASWRKHWLNQWHAFDWPMAFMKAMCNSSSFYNYFWWTYLFLEFVSMKSHLDSNNI